MTQVDVNKIVAKSDVNLLVSLDRPQWTTLYLLRQVTKLQYKQLYIAALTLFAAG